MNHCIGCHTFAFTVAHAVLWLEVLLHIKVFHIRCATKGDGEALLSFLENQKKKKKKKKKDALVLEKKGPDFVDQNIVLRVSRTRHSKSFCWSTSILDFLRKCLLKCPNFKKPPLPWTFSACAPAYIWYRQSDLCSLELYWQYVQKSWWSSGMIPEYVTWCSIPSQDQYCLQ